MNSVLQSCLSLSLPVALSSCLSFSFKVENYFLDGWFWDGIFFFVVGMVSFFSQIFYHEHTQTSFLSFSSLPTCGSKSLHVVAFTLCRLEKQTANIRLAEEQARRGQRDLYRGADDSSSMSDFGMQTFCIISFFVSLIINLFI